MTFIEKIQKLEPMIGVEIYSGSQQIVEVMGGAGFDFAMLDMEHTPYSLQHISTLVNAAELSGMSPIIRVPRLDEVHIMQAFDVGAQGVIVPRITTAAETERAVASAWFPPHGTRGMCPGVRATKHHYDVWKKYAKNAKNETVVIPLIEDIEAINNIDEIMSVEGMRAVLFGPGDFGVSIGGIERGFDAQIMRETKDALIELCRAGKKHGVYVIAIPYQDMEDDEDTIRNVFDDGVNGVLYPMDTMFLGALAEGIREKFLRVSKKGK